jgi:phosphatidylinositol glycan class B
MTAARLRLSMGGLLLLSAALRLLAMIWDPPLHPDEYYQYLEPAWWHLTGVGLTPWEFHEGVRSWFLPFYNGAWMALLLKLGVPAGAPIGWLLKAHWAVINVSVVVLAFRGGASISRRLQRLTPTALDEPPGGWEGGLLAAAACALFPLLISYAGHTLSELPSMLCTIAALVLTSELLESGAADGPEAARKAAWVGALLSLSACLRIVNAPLTLVAPAWLLVRGRVRLLGVLTAAGFVPVLVFGLIDLVSWGSFARSFVGYIEYNFIEGKAADFGTEPPGWYLGTLVDRAGFALPLLILPALLGLRATWPHLLSATALLAYLSTQPHKEERFIIAFWPLLLIAAAGTLGARLAQLRARLHADEDVRIGPTRMRRALPWCAVAWLALVLAGSTQQLRSSERWVAQRDRLDALAWLGAQPNVTGLVGDEPFTGGSLWFSAEVPYFVLVPGLVSSPIISHALVLNGSKDERIALKAGFTLAHRVGAYRVLQRQ